MHGPKVGAAHTGRYADSAFSIPPHESGTFCHFLPVTSTTSVSYRRGVLAGKLLRMTANTLRDTERPVSSRRQVVERAEAFLNAHVGEPISIAALSRAAGVSERSLRNAFYDVRGMSPKRSVVRTRLAQVRRALSDAQGTRGAVTAIATDYGFFELGRFAGTYKAAFGETPSETLCSGRAS